MTYTATRGSAIDVRPEVLREPIRIAGAACAFGGLALAVGAVSTQILQASTSVSDQLWRYPWGTRAAVINWSVWGLMEAFVLVGVLAWGRSGAAGPSRSARVGLALAVVGTLAIVAGHVASIAVRSETVDDTGAQLVGGVFALGTVLSAAGLLTAGWCTLRAGVWHGWRRFVPLSIGVVTVALIPLQLTAALPTAVAVYALGFVALGVALMQTRPVPER